MAAKLAVLITDVHLRKAFDIFNIIRRHKEYNIVLAAPFATVLLSLLYNRKVYKLRTESDHTFTEDLLLIAKRTGNITYLPVEEKTTLRFYAFLKGTDHHTFSYLLPSIDQFQLAANKLKLNVFCLENNIPAPAIFSFSEARALDPIIPLVIKPKHGSGSKGIVYIATKEELKDVVIDNEPEYIIQEKIGHDNKVEGAFVLCKDGEVIDFYSHLRLRTYPVKGGVTVYSVTQNNISLLEVARPLARKLKWNGVMMVEYIFDVKTGTYKIIEINPRLWGSFLLGEFPGFALLNNYIRLTNGLPVKEAFNSKEKKFIRWMFPYDLMNYIKTGGKVKNFWSFNKQTCYIGFTYANLLAAICFIVLLPFLKFTEKIKTR